MSSYRTFSFVVDEPDKCALWLWCILLKSAQLIHVLLELDPPQLVSGNRIAELNGLTLQSSIPIRFATRSDI